MESEFRAASSFEFREELYLISRQVTIPALERANFRKVPFIDHQCNVTNQKANDPSQKPTCYHRFKTRIRPYFLPQTKIINNFSIYVFNISSPDTYWRKQDSVSLLCFLAEFLVRLKSELSQGLQGCVCLWYSHRGIFLK